MSEAGHYSEQAKIEDSARLALLQGKHQQAYQLLMDALKIYPRFARGYFLLSRIAYDFKNHLKEVEMLSAALHVEPDNVEFIVYLARAQVLVGNSSDAHELLMRAEKHQGHTAEIYDLMGVAYNRLSMYQEAAVCFQRSIECNSDNAGVFFNLASTLKFCGDFPAARMAYEQAIALKPDYFKAHAALTSLGGISHEHNHVARLRELLEKTVNADDSLCIAHALSKELEALKDWSGSITALQCAKQKKLAQLHYDFSRDKAIFEKLQNAYSVGINRQQSGFNNNRPLFVTGMPRTGTTLVERILSSHSRVASGGELYNFSIEFKRLIGSISGEFIDNEFIEHVKRVDIETLGRAYIDSTDYLLGNKQFLIDKLPLNILYAGLIIDALPAAKVVCLDRNPLDTIVSNYRQLFSFQDSTFAYSLSLEHTAHYYVAFKKWTDHLLAIYPDNVYRLNYEALVSNPEREIKTLLDFCGLPWEEDCLHIERNTKPVATASAVQVRQPITAAGIGQWKHYAAHLESAVNILENAGLAFDL
ncbi:tetratricopeptide repeat-containing sulfotransferase family protein [Cellvibrio sp. UBA7661]|uniref:tetratricopeptide repeat-containing sulfotransferase family protein n=1 Tax=Cellvibrio sp. UBA7661 TaxID=1946311 RepID=UPI002F359A73